MQTIIPIRRIGLGDFIHEVARGVRELSGDTPPHSRSQDGSMLNHRVTRLVLRAAFLVTVVNLVSACASDARYSSGKNYAVESEAERKRLNDAGFPQYTSGD